MPKSNSVSGKLWDLAKTLVAVAILGWLAWYAYSLLDPASSGVGDSVPGASFNCRKALADLATDYACMNSDSCTMTPNELAELKNREAAIDQYCD